MQKDFFRDDCIKKMKHATKRGKLLKNKMACKKVSCLLKTLKYKSILFYIPIDIEVDIMPILKQSRRLKKKVFVPFMQGKSFKMVSYRLPVKVGRFGIKEPNYSIRDFLNVDVALVPVVGVDRGFKRVGFGMGMYDRFFGVLRNRPTTIFIQSVKCFSGDYLSNCYDIDADFYVTPRDIFFSKGKLNVNRVHGNICVSRCRGIFHR